MRMIGCDLHDSTSENDGSLYRSGVDHDEGSQGNLGAYSPNLARSAASGRLTRLSEKSVPALSPVVSQSLRFAVRFSCLEGPP